MGYRCIFDKTKDCPVKTEYKLKPESLVEFCRVCLKRQELSIGLDLDSTRWYQVMKAEGYSHSLEKFVNECIQDFFREKGLALAIIAEPPNKEETKKNEVTQ